MVDIKPLIKKSFIVIAVISCFTCYARPDYNLPLFAFAYLLWDIKLPVKFAINYFKIKIIFIINKKFN